MRPEVLIAVKLSVFFVDSKVDTNALEKHTVSIFRAVKII
jgi:hypothetical protein